MTSMRQYPSLLACAAAAAALFGGLSTVPVRAGAQAAPPPPPAPPEIREPAAPPAPGTPTPGTPAPPPPPEAGTETPGTPPSPETTPPAGGRQLQLPDISLIGNLVGHVGNDRGDTGRDRFELEEAEIGIQGFVYPGIRADAFIVFAENEAALEEGFLTVENIGFGLPVGATVGKRFVPFGRTNQLHPHSYPYVVNPFVLTNLVSGGESLVGQGGYLSVLLPTPFFAQIDAGFWSGAEAHAHGEEHEEGEEEEHETPAGAGFEDRFLTLRLWTAFPALGGDLEVGGSVARGRGLEYEMGEEPEDGNVPVAAQRGRQVGLLTVRPTIQLSALDLTYRRSGRGASRLLLRGEYVRHRQKDAGFQRTVDGYYLLADQRLDAFTSLGLRYDWSAFPFAPDEHESAVSLIGTRQLNESTYARVQLIHGGRPGKRDFSEAHLQIVFGIGPHTHRLE